MGRPTTYDHAARKKARRSGREKGVHIYIPAEVIGEMAETKDLYYQLGGGVSSDTSGGDSPLPTWNQ